MVRPNLYVASKAKYGETWQLLRDVQGWPIISTWIDEYKPGQTEDLSELWDRCVDEAMNADALLVYAESGETLKGALVEVGVAIGSSVPIYAVVPDNVGSWVHYPYVKRFASIAAALASIEEDFELPSYGDVAGTKLFGPILSETDWLPEVHTIDTKEKFLEVYGNPIESDPPIPINKLYDIPPPIWVDRPASGTAEAIATAIDWLYSDDFFDRMRIVTRSDLEEHCSFVTHRFDERGQFSVVPKSKESKALLEKSATLGVDFVCFDSVSDLVAELGQRIKAAQKKHGLI